MNLSTRQKRLLKWIGYPLLALVSFVFAVAHSFPYDRMVQRAEAAMAGKAELEVVAIKPGFLPGNVSLEGVNLKVLPRGEGQKPVAIFIDRIDISVGLLPALLATLSVSVEAELGGGVLNASFKSKRSSWSASGSTEDFPLAMLPPGVHQAFGGLPLGGGLTAEFQLAAPTGQLQEMEGSASMSCAGCTVGDGKAKVQNQPMPGMRGPMAFAEGPTVPVLSLGNATVNVDIKKGRAKLDLKADSPDGAMRLDWDVELAPKLGESKVTGCTRFKFAEALRSRAETFVNIQMSMSSNKEPDGMIALPLHRIATLGNIRMNQREKCGAPGKPSEPAPGSWQPGTGAPPIPSIPPPGPNPADVPPQPDQPPVDQPPPPTDQVAPPPIEVAPPIPQPQPAGDPRIPDNDGDIDEARRREQRIREMEQANEGEQPPQPIE